jgi:site-specific recombinase XerD
MIEDMAARQLGRHSHRSHIHSCQRFAAFLKRSPDTASADDVRRFQLHLIESGLSICNRNRIMTGVRFLFRVTLRRHDLAAEVYHLKEPQKLPLVMSPDEAKQLLGYFHLVFTLPAPIADIAYQNKRLIYDLLFKAAAETTLTIAADAKHLGARIGITAVLHT